MTQKRKHYEMPQLTVAEFKTERGYAESLLFTGALFMMHNTSFSSFPNGSSELEMRTITPSADSYGWSTEF